MTFSATPPVRILFICTHNSARSILAEALLNHLGHGQVRALSAGSQPRPDQQPHPLALQALAEAGVPTAGLHSKHWDQFAGPGAPPIDLLITVCDSAAGEICPLFTGAPDGSPPVRVHWGYPDPSAAGGDEAARLQAFRRVRDALHRRLERLLTDAPSTWTAERIVQRARELAAEPTGV